MGGIRKSKFIPGNTKESMLTLLSRRNLKAWNDPTEGKYPAKGYHYSAQEW
jgi:hypothetical protein